MNANAEEMELRERLDLMQRMINEGRRKQESWGWTFVLWGVAYYVAFFWAWLGSFPLAWPITMTAGGILTFIGFSRRQYQVPETTIGRAIASIWIATGSSMFILFDAMGFGLHLADPRAFQRPRRPSPAAGLQARPGGPVVQRPALSVAISRK